MRFKNYLSNSILTTGLLFLVFTTSYNALGQVTHTYHQTLNWQSKAKANQIKTKVTFENYAYIDETGLPIWIGKYPISKGSSIKVTLLNTEYKNSSDVTIADISNLLKSNNPEYSFTISTEKKKDYALIILKPFRLNGKAEVLRSFDIQVTETAKNTALRISGQRTYTQQSILANGNWYKLGIIADGVYKLSYSYLKSIGVNVDNIDPKNIQIYGNGGGMLPAANSVFRYDDLTENAIQVVNKQDGTFKDGDYVLFYGQGPHRWTYNKSDGHFHHQINQYSDSTYYFFSADKGPGKRINMLPANTLTANKNVNTFDDYAFHDIEKLNLIQSGQLWLGEIFDNQTTQGFTFNFPNLNAATGMYINTAVVSQSIKAASSFAVQLNGNTIINSIDLGAVSGGFDDTYATSGSKSVQATSSQDNNTVTLIYTKQTPAAIGWLNYIEVNARRTLSVTGNQMSYRDTSTLGPNNVVGYNITNMPANYAIWDVSTPTNVQDQAFSGSGSVSYTAKADTLHEYIAFNTLTGLLTPVSSVKITNQNLHGLAQTDMIIVSYPDFLPEAQRLADFHKSHDNLRVTVVTPQLIYNEFGNGAQDITAIRSFVKMFYDRATDSIQMPKYLLLLGDGSYDMKNRVSGNTNYIPTYQSLESLNPVNSYTSDDYYGVLDDNEGLLTTNEIVDIAIGRIPAKTLMEARAVVNKTIHYITDPICMGDWRNVVTFIADDVNFPSDSEFITQADALATMLDTTLKNLNIDKIYLDAYKQETTPGGARYPDVTIAINNRLNRGTLITNYTGHGGQNGFSHERVLTTQDVTGWTNLDKLSLFITATCEFSRYDDPALTSAGEFCILSPTGGAIGMLTTVRLTTGSPNFSLNTDFYTLLLKNKTTFLGELFRRTKNLVLDDNSRNFSYLGDPAVKLSLPTYNVMTTSLNIIGAKDTLKALCKVSVSGYVADMNGNRINDFNGVLSPTVFDKASILKTLDNHNTYTPVNFTLQKQALFRGKASVTNGNFSFSFIVPKDIAYNYGKGKLSFYADNGTIDASGNNRNIIIGGTGSNTVNDIAGPSCRVYMNDEKFVFGGLTDANPTLLALLTDSSGINMTGNGLGHDLNAYLDEDVEHPMNLNDYYQADLNSYQKGHITYPLHTLKEGKHTLRLKAWDVYNNSSETNTEFVVASSSKIALDHVLNYPNPFSTHTSFYFEHNKPGMFLQVQIQILTISGRIIKTINTLMTTQGYRSEGIDWDGRDDFGDKIGRGVYVYRVRVRTNGETYNDKYQKLVILN